MQDHVFTAEQLLPVPRDEVFAFFSEPRNLEAATLQCRLLRLLERPEQALAIAEQFEAFDDGDLETVRAGALCDLGRWAEAQEVAAGIFPAPNALLNRIRLAGRPAV